MRGRSVGLWNVGSQFQITEDDTTPETPIEVLGYFDIAALLSTQLGKNVLQSSVFRLVGYDIGIVMDADSTAGVGGMWSSGDLRFMSPTASRVRAHKYMANAWLQQTRSRQQAQALLTANRGRQFMVKYSDTMPDAGYHSTMEEPGSSTDVEVGLFGSTVGGTYSAIMDQWNLGYPPFPDPGGAGEDQRLYTNFADDSTPVILPWTVAMGNYNDYDESTDTNERTFAKTANGWSWRAPAGHHYDVMCGLVEVNQNGTSVAIIPESPVNADIYVVLHIAGWRDLR